MESKKEQQDRDALAFANEKLSDHIIRVERFAVVDGDASIQLGLDSGVLSRCCRSNSRRYKGFIYKYKDLWKQYSTTM